MLEGLTKKHLRAIRDAQTEPQWWLAFENFSREVAGYPNGLVVLWTPAVRMAVFGGFGVSSCLERVDEEEGVLVSRRALSMSTIGEVRRCVRDGNYVLSLRDTQRQWKAVLDGRLPKKRFMDPMAPSKDLGLLPAVSPQGGC